MNTSKRLLVGLPVLLAAGVAVGLLFYSPPSDAKKKVDLGWSPEALVTESLAPGEEATYSVVMKNVGNSSIAPTHQLQIVTEGDIASYLTIEQPSFPKGTFQSGDEVSFDVTVSVPENAPVGVSYGTLFLRRILSSGKVKEEWRAEGLYTTVVVLGDTLPYYTAPDPGMIVTDPDGGTFPANQISMVLIDEATREDADRIAESVNGTLIGFISGGNIYQLQIPATTVAEFREIQHTLESFPSVEFTFTNSRLQLFQSYNTDLENLRAFNSDLTYAYQRIGLFDVWSRLAATEIPERRMLVGIVDTGIDITHPEFDTWNDDMVILTSVTQDNATPGACLEVNSHGTEITGIIGASNLSSISSLHSGSPEMNGILSGVPNLQYALVIPDANLDASPSEFASEMLAAMQEAIDKHANVINMSWGQYYCEALPDSCLLSLNPMCNFNKCMKEHRLCQGGDFFYTHRAFNKFIKDYEEVLFVAAAGNSRILAEHVVPAAIERNNVITVAATTLDETATWAIFSNEGAVIDIAAPGKDVYAPTATLPSGSYNKSFDGTSAAAPMVTGVAAMMMALDDTLKAKQIAGILRGTASPACVPGERSGCLVNADAAVERVLNLPFALSDRVHVELDEGFLAPVLERPADTVVDYQRPDARGVAVDGPSRASNVWWWYVDFDVGEDGWVAEEYLEKVTNALSFEDVLRRSIVDWRELYEETGYGFYRKDRFTNISDSPVRLHSVQFLYLDPADVGIPDIDPNDVVPVYDAAESLYPAFGLWGTWWWEDDPDTVVWLNTTTPRDLEGVVLAPDEYIDVEHTSINDITPAFNNGLPLIIRSEQVVGFQFTGVTELSGIPIDSIQFTDANLDQCVAEQAEQFGWSYAEDVTELNCSAHNISSVEGIERFTNLTHLWLAGNQIVDTTSIQSLSNLEILDLRSNNQEYDIAPLVALPRILVLLLTGNYIDCNQVQTLEEAYPNVDISSNCDAGGT